MGKRVFVEAHGSSVRCRAVLQHVYATEKDRGVRAEPRPRKPPLTSHHCNGMVARVKPCGLVGLLIFLR